MTHVEFAGVDGSGKSTQAELLCSALSSRCILRERKETALLNLLIHLAAPECGDPVRAFGADTFFLLRMAEAHLDDERALEAGGDQEPVVISPRSQLDRLAAAMAAGVRARTLAALDCLASAHPPTVGIFLSVDPEVALARIAARGGEPAPDPVFFRAFSHHLARLARQRGYREVDASQDPRQVSSAILGLVRTRGIL